MGGGQAWLIRPGASSDCAFLARVDMQASTPPFAVTAWQRFVEPVGTPVLAFLEAMYRHRANNWGNPEDFLVLEADGSPAAAIAGFAAKTGDRRNIDLERLPAMAKSLGWDARQIEIFLERYHQIWGPVEALSYMEPHAEWLLESLAVMPEARGRGFARRLLDAVVREGRAKGHRSAGMFMVQGNVAAATLFEAAGFTVWARHDSDEFGGDYPGIVKYRRSLDE